MFIQSLIHHNHTAVNHQRLYNYAVLWQPGLLSPEGPPKKFDGPRNLGEFQAWKMDPQYGGGSQSYKYAKVQHH